MKYVYTAILTPEENGAFSVRFPDFPGCYTSGDNLADAVNMARDALCLWLYDLEQEKRSIPPARSPYDLKTVGDEFSSIISVDTETYRHFNFR